MLMPEILTLYSLTMARLSGEFLKTQFVSESPEHFNPEFPARLCSRLDAVGPPRPATGGAARPDRQKSKVLSPFFDRMTSFILAPGLFG